MGDTPGVVREECAGFGQATSGWHVGWRGGRTESKAARLMGTERLVQVQGPERTGWRGSSVPEREGLEHPAEEL